MPNGSFFCRVARPPAIPALALAVVLGAAPLHAGIMRDVLEDLHIVKPPRRPRPPRASRCLLFRDSPAATCTTTAARSASNT